METIKKYFVKYFVFLVIVSSPSLPRSVSFFISYVLIDFAILLPGPKVVIYLLFHNILIFLFLLEESGLLTLPVCLSLNHLAQCPSLTQFSPVLACLLLINGSTGSQIYLGTDRVFALRPRTSWTGHISHLALAGRGGGGHPGFP